MPGRLSLLGLWQRQMKGADHQSAINTTNEGIQFQSIFSPCVSLRVEQLSSPVFGGKWHFHIRRIGHKIKKANHFSFKKQNKTENVFPTFPMNCNGAVGTTATSQGDPGISVKQSINQLLFVKYKIAPKGISKGFLQLCVTHTHKQPLETVFLIFCQFSDLLNLKMSHCLKSKLKTELLFINPTMHGFVNHINKGSLRA